MFKILFPLALLLSIVACQKTNENPERLETPGSYPEQIIFGLSYGMCTGECSENYRITATAIYPDACTYCYPTLEFQTTPLDNQQFQAAKPLLESVPEELLSAEKTVFGCPGCRDEGAYYLEITQNGEKHVVRWSEDYTDVPDNLRPYFEQIAQMLEHL